MTNYNIEGIKENIKKFFKFETTIKEYISEDGTFVLLLTSSQLKHTLVFQIVEDDVEEDYLELISDYAINDLQSRKDIDYHGLYMYMRFWR